MGLHAVANICKQISVAILGKKKRNRLQKCITTKIGNIIEGITFSEREDISTRKRIEDL